MNTTPAYKHLVQRPHPWRKQLYLKGVNVTVGQMVATMNANHWTPEEAVQELDLPLEQVAEAISYYETHRRLIEEEFAKEAQLLLKTGIDVTRRKAPARAS